MRRKLRTIFTGPVVFYPLLFAAFPVLFLYAYNIRQTTTSDLWLPLAITVASALVLWAILSLILGSLSKAGLATVVFLALFFSYGRLYDGLSYLGVSVPKHAYLLPTMLFAWGYCVYFIGRAGRGFLITTRMLNVVAVVLVAMTLFGIASYRIGLTRAEGVTPTEMSEQAVVSHGEPGTLPDIYFIILDDYAHPDTMKEWYDHDDGRFIEGLEDMGFFVSLGSRTRTPHSPQVIAQILNMEYLTGGWQWDEGERRWVEMTWREPGAGDQPWSDPTFRKLAYSRVAEFLKAQGYKYIVFGGWGDVGRWDSYMRDNVDLYFNYYVTSATPWVSEFQFVLWNTTMLRPFYQRIVGSQYETAYRRQTLYTLAHLGAIPGEVQGPKLVYVHFASPHEPFVFGPGGEYIDPSNWFNYRDRQFYLGQCMFMSAQISEMVNIIVKESATEPIIIIQSDHGPRPHSLGIDIGADEWQKILNAMYLPGMDYDVLSDSISPVNTFRLIFDHYFGTDYGLLEDD